jgi:hypothetical protein
MSYVVVRFPEPREVYVDDEGQGSNTRRQRQARALFVNAGKHTFRLRGAGVDPPEQTLNVPERPILNPYPVESSGSADAPAARSPSRFAVGLTALGVRCARQSASGAYGTGWLPLRECPARGRRGRAVRDPRAFGRRHAGGPSRTGPGEGLQSIATSRRRGQSARCSTMST